MILPRVEDGVTVTDTDDGDDDIRVVYEARRPLPPPKEDLVISDYPNPPTVTLHWKNGKETQQVKPPPPVRSSDLILGCCYGCNYFPKPSWDTVDAFMTRTSHVRTRTQPQNYFSPSWQNTMLVPPLTRGQVYYGNAQQYKQYMELRHSVHPFPGIPQTSYNTPQLSYYKQPQCISNDFQTCRPTSLYIPNLSQGSLMEPGLPHGPLDQYLGGDLGMNVTTPTILPPNMNTPLSILPQPYAPVQPNVTAVRSSEGLPLPATPVAITTTTATTSSGVAVVEGAGSLPYLSANITPSSISLSDLTPPTSDQAESGNKTPTLTIPDVVCDMEDMSTTTSSSNFLSPTSPLSEFDQFLESIDDSASLDDEHTLSNLSGSPPFGKSLPYCENNAVPASTTQASVEGRQDNVSDIIPVSLSNALSVPDPTPGTNPNIVPAPDVEHGALADITHTADSSIQQIEVSSPKKRNGKRRRKSSNKSSRKPLKNNHILEKVFTGTLLGENMKTSELFDDTGSNSRESGNTRHVGYSYHNLVYSQDTKWGSSDVKVRILSNPLKVPDFTNTPRSRCKAPPTLPSCTTTIPTPPGTTTTIPTLPGTTTTIPKPLLSLQEEDVLSSISNEILDIGPSWNSDAIFDVNCDVIW